MLISIIRRKVTPMTDLMDSCVELVEKERECLFALQGSAGKQVAVPQTELHLKEMAIFNSGPQMKNS